MAEVDELLKSAAKAGGSGDFKTAINLLNTAEKADSKERRVYEIRGYLMFLSGKQSEALTDYEKAIGLNPNAYMPWYRKAECLFEMNRLEEALSCVDKAVGSNDESYKAWELGGRILALLDRPDEALEAYGNAIKLNPSDDISWSGRSYVFALKKEYDLALKSAKKALELQPDDQDYVRQVKTIKSLKG